MNRDEAAVFVAEVRALCPGMAIVPGIVDAWLGVVGDLPIGECRSALLKHARSDGRIPAPADVRRGVLAARQDAAMRELPAGPALPPGAPETFGGLPIPGAPPWVRGVYERAKAEQHEINRQRREQGLPPTFGKTVMATNDGRIPRRG